MSTPTELLQHYLTMIMRQCGFQVEGDTYAEIAEIVEGIQTPLEKRITSLEDRMRDCEKPRYILHSNEETADDAIRQGLEDIAYGRYREISSVEDLNGED